MNDIIHIGKLDEVIKCVSDLRSQLEFCQKMVKFLLGKRDGKLIHYTQEEFDSVDDALTFQCREHNGLLVLQLVNKSDYGKQPQEITHPELRRDGPA